MSELRNRAEELGCQWAYPQPLGPDGLPTEADCFDGFEPGLTKRELFAAMAMQGLLADSCGNGVESVVPDGHDLAHIASVAVKCADALLAELAKPQEGGAA